MPLGLRYGLISKNFFFLALIIIYFVSFLLFKTKFCSYHMFATYLSIFNSLGLNFFDSHSFKKIWSCTCNKFNKIDLWFPILQALHPDIYPYRVKHDMVIVHCSFNVASDASAAFDTFYQTNETDRIFTTYQNSCWHTF